MKRNIYISGVGLVVLGVLGVTGTLAQMYPMFWDDDEAVPEAATYGEATLTVEGEVRTVQPSGAPRLWGRGRPGAVRHGKLGSLGEELCANGPFRFGLSEIMVDWGSAADACPAGTWVCAEWERGSLPCNTLRNDGSRDGNDCSGGDLDWTQDGHKGWLANVEGTTIGRIAVEAGGLNSLRTCYHLPVWCCSEVP